MNRGREEREGVMFQQHRGIVLPVLGAIVLCLLVGGYLFAARRSAKKDEPAIEGHRVERSPEETLKYWTKGRMRKAKPAPMPHVNEGTMDKQSGTQRSSEPRKSE